MLNLTANRETPIHRASEQAEFIRMVVIWHFFFTHESVMDGNSSTFLCREYSEPRNSHVLKIGPVKESEVFECALQGHS